VVIDQLGPISGDEARSGLSTLTANGEGGVVEAERDGNTVTLDAFRVRRLTLLISPDVFDMRSPIRVVANGEVVFDAMVPSSVETLKKWEKVDEDRTMLYAAEVTIELEL
jgi:hypothetical protein